VSDKEETPVINQVITEEKQPSPLVDAQVVESVPTEEKINPAEVVEGKVEAPVANPVIAEETQPAPPVDSHVIESASGSANTDAAVTEVEASKPPVVRQPAEPVKKTTTTSSDGPIRAWSNPPGYMGSQKKVIMVKKKK
jgi:hypothetical protein